MSARTRFALDIALMIGLVAAYQPTWTGISPHQWLSIAIIAPLLLHVIVNWEWALRVARTFVARLLGASRLNFAIDCSLFLASVTVMLSGFMVSPALIAPLGIHPTNPVAWHTLHSWSANATISLLAVHGLLHWSWFLGTAKRLAESLKPKPRPSRAALRARVLAAAATARVEAARPAHGDAIARLRSRVGSRAAQAAAERATALRTASVIGVTLVVGMAIFAGVGMASPLLSPTSGSTSKRLAKADLQVCPQTGCAASTCHGTTGADPTVFYGHTPSAAKAPAKAKRQTTNARRRSATHVTSNRTVRTGAGIAAAPKKPSVAVPAVKARSAATTKRMVCPQTGCSASSCHGAHNQSAASYYN